MIIGFSLDTNILIGSTPKATLLSSNLDIFKKYISTLKRRKHPVELKLLLTEMVIKEVLEHQKNKLYTTYSSLKKNYDDMSYSLTGDIPLFTPEKTISNEEKYINKLNVIKIPCTDTVFSKLISNSVEKKPPFTKNNSKKGDAGFKDAVIWESILSSSEIDECEKFYFFTSDNDFWSEKQYLLNEFKNSHPNTNFELINITGDSKNQQILNHLIEDNNLIKNDIFKLYQEENVLSFLKQISNIDIEISSKEGLNEIINFDLTHLSLNNIDIKDVIQENDCFDVYLRLTTYYNLDYTSYLYINLKLSLKKSGNSFKYQNFELLDSGYLDSIFKICIKNLNELSTTLSRLAIEPMKEFQETFNSKKFQDTILNFSDQFQLNVKQLQNSCKTIGDSLSTDNNMSKVIDLKQK